MIEELRAKWAFEVLTHQLTDLEVLTIELNALIRPMRCDRTNYAPPAFKPDDNYLTHEGFYLGSVCWYVRCLFDGRREMVCARTPERAMELAIEGFQLFLLARNRADGDSSPSGMSEWRQRLRAEAEVESKRQGAWQREAYKQWQSLRNRT
jgi:hypothetical protein